MTGIGRAPSGSQSKRRWGRPCRTDAPKFPEDLYLLVVSTRMSKGSLSIVGMMIGAGLRFASIWWGLQLPVFQLGEDGVAKEKEE